MRKVKKILLALFVLMFSLFLIFNLIWPPKSGVIVSSNPTSSVFINGKKVGKTPFEGVLNPGEVVIKLVPDNSEGEFETKVNLTSGVRTVIQRQFGYHDSASAGFIGSFEKIDPKKTMVSVVSIPENAQVFIDGQVRGNTPLSIDDVSPGKHELSVVATDYFGKTVSVRFYRGYRLVAFFELLPRKNLGATKDIK